MTEQVSSIIVDSRYPYREEWKINVTDKHRGVAGNHHQCGIVNAIHEQYPELLNVTVGEQTIRFRDPATDQNLTLSTPRNAARYQRDHDKRSDVLPNIAFTLHREEAEVRPVQHRITTQRTTPVNKVKRKSGKPRKSSRRAN